LGVPEYQYENKIDVIKPKDKVLLIEYLELREEEDRKKAAAEAEAAAAALAGAGAGGAKKVDPKKDAGKKPAAGKGAVVADDKNAPQTLTIEYEEIEHLDDFIILERKYNFNDEKIAAAHKKGPPASAGAALGSGKGSSWGDMSKVKDRTQELISQYKIIRSKPYTVAILLKLNKEVERAPEPVEEVAPTVPDPKAKGKK